MNNRLLLFISALFASCVSFMFCACTGSSFLRQKLIFPELDVVFSKNGQIHSYKIDMNKPKVVTYIWGEHNLRRLLSETPSLKINNLISRNPEIDFIFYLDGINLSDVEKILPILDKYDVTYPIILDFNSIFAEANGNRYLKGKTDDCCTLYGYFCDKSNRIFKSGGGIIGTEKSKMYFDPSFARFKATL